MKLVQLLWDMLPAKVQSRIMNRIIMRGYAVNSYNDKYRGRTLTETERNILDRLVRYIGSGSTVLDVGCGSADFYDKYLVRNGCHIHGVDISYRQIKLAMNNLPSETFTCQDFMKEKYRKKQYNAVTMFYSYFNIPVKRQKELIQKVYDVLKYDGVFLLNVRKEDAGTLKYWKRWCDAPMIWSYRSYKWFIQKAVDVGFEVQPIRNPENEEYVWLWCTKKRR